MKYLVMLLAALLLMLGTVALFWVFGGEEQPSPPVSEPPSSAASQVVRQQPLTPTLVLGSQTVRAGATLRDARLSQETIQAASRQLGEAAGSATILEEGGLPGFRFSQQPDQVLATLIPVGLEGEPYFQGSLEELADYIPPEDGDYTLDVWAGWNGGEESFAGVAGYRALLTYQLPKQPIRLTVDTVSLRQGYCAVLRAGNLPEGVTQVTAETDMGYTMGYTPTFYPYQGEMIALMPARYNGNTGEYHVTIHAGEESQSFTVTVTDGGFDVTVQQFDVDQGVADSTVNNNEANEVYEAVTRPLKNMGDPEKYWEGAFQLPIDPQYKASTSTFGRIRVINGSRSQHAGIDYPAPKGTQVYAPNNGRVLYADFLQLTGNTICIEHGFGLKSWFYHLDSVEVEAGQMVKTGDPIGKVGTTGFSTGPHLHFTMSVNNIYTNPEQYLEADPLG